MVSEKRFWAEKRYGVLIVISQKYRGFARNPGCRSADESVWIVFLGEGFWGVFFVLEICGFFLVGLVDAIFVVGSVAVVVFVGGVGDAFGVRFDAASAAPPAAAATAAAICI